MILEGTVLAPPVRRVRLLDPHTVNQIAAGEVVERPAAALKELVENALDAGARRIEIAMVDAGRTLLRVSDDGEGMDEGDALAALERHATSKLASAEELSGVLTLGFRGEALPSIASVSRLTLSTGREDGGRTVLRVDGGIVAPPEREAGPRGTTVTVEDLFHNTPARLKFLKSDTTEVGQAVDVVMRLAVAYPRVAFLLTHNGQEALRTEGTGETREAVAAVWGREMARALVPVESELGGMRLSGFVSPPHVTKPTRAFQYVFVNGRSVRTRTLTAALDQAFRDLTPDRRFPLVALHIGIAPSEVDVNVSPTKSEVKFRREGLAFEAIRAGTKAALGLHGMMPSAGAVAAVNQAMAEARAPAPALSWLPAEPGNALLDPRQEHVAPPVPGVSGNFQSFAPPSRALPFADLLDGLRIVGQAMNAFIVAETAHGLVVVDQHVAHERILYESLCGIRGAGAIERQALLVPVPLHLDRRSALLLSERRGEIEALGFDVEPFGEGTWIVRGAPAALKGKDPARVLRDLVEELVDAAVTRRLVPTRELIWITTSCKMAVKAGDPLSHAEMERLVVELAATENPYLCPHGRPITVTLTTDDLLKLFKRK